jgi:hypothetical protein
MCDLLLTVRAVAVGCAGAAAYVRHHERHYTAMDMHWARELFAPPHERVSER